jgi:dienelactone hydrolase
MFRLSRIGALALAILMSFQAHAEISYVDMLKSLTPGKKNIVSEIPDINSLLQIKSIAEAQSVLQNKMLDTDGRSGSLTPTQVYSLVRQKTLTIVVVPGVLGEFIDIRAFEEVFSRDSFAKRQWAALSKRTNAMDQRFDLEKLKQVPQKLSELVDVASIDDAAGKPMIKLVILKTILGSLESVGSNSQSAAVFNRRLQKYINLTNDQNVVLLGYSRGTPLALEMVTQAESQKLPYLSRVKALVSYAGVVSGSALADVTDDPTSDSGVLLQAVKTLRSELQTADNLLDRVPKRAHNTQAVAALMYSIATHSPVNPEALLNNVRSGDFRSVAILIAKVAGEIGLKNAFAFNDHVERTRYFITEVLKAVEELKSSSRTQWWRTHTLPKNIQYRSLVASMVDPDHSSIEKAIYDSKEGYSDSLDDRSLIENMRSYKSLTGISLNDSQVAVHQSLFLPQVIATLNPNNAGLDIKPMGVLQTHHWGVALEVVNKMKDGRLNPFPREKVLMSLAAYLNQ